MNKSLLVAGAIMGLGLTVVFLSAKSRRSTVTKREREQAE